MPRKRKPASSLEDLTAVETEDEGETPETELEADPETDPIPETAPKASEKPARRKPMIARPLQPMAPRVDLRVYLASCGDKADQVAGFAAWARKQNLPPRTILEWRETRDTFNRRPV